MRDLEPGEMTFPRDVEDRRSSESPGALRRELGIRTGQRADERGVVRFRAASGEVAGDLGWKSAASGHGADGMGLDLDRSRGGCRCRQLRVERSGDAVCTLRREGRRRVEQPEIPRMSDMNDALL